MLKFSIFAKFGLWLIRRTYSYVWLSIVWLFSAHIIFLPMQITFLKISFAYPQNVWMRSLPMPKCQIPGQKAFVAKSHFLSPTKATFVIALADLSSETKNSIFILSKLKFLHHKAYNIFWQTQKAEEGANYMYNHREVL